MTTTNNRLFSMAALLLVMALLVVPLPMARAAAAPATVAGTYTGTLTATAASCSATGTACVVVPLNALVGSVAIQMTGTFSATMTFEATVDNVNWVAAAAVPPTATQARTTTATAAGIWQINTSGYMAVRVRCSTFTSGSAVVTIRRSGVPPGNGS